MHPAARNDPVRHGQPAVQGAGHVQDHGHQGIPETPRIGAWLAVGFYNETIHTYAFSLYINIKKIGSK